MRRLASWNAAVAIPFLACVAALWLVTGSTPSRNSFDRPGSWSWVGPVRHAPGWYAGDFQLHPKHGSRRTVAVSRPSSQDALVPRVIDVAVSAGLDFVFVSDDDTSFVSINHPPGPDDASCVACGWNDDRKEVLEELDGVEVVNGSDWKGPLSGWPFWADALNGGAPLALVGGSDDHTVDEHRDATPGSPTTMVFAKALSEASLVEGLKAGRTYVRVRGPNGPAIEFTVRVGGQSFGLGDVIQMAPFTTVALEAVVTGAPGQMLEWIRQGEPLQSVAASDAVPMRLEARARPGDWFSVIVSDEEGPTLMTGAIYTDAP